MHGLAEGDEIWQGRTDGMTVGWQVIAALSGGWRASAITKRARQGVSASSIGPDVGQNEKRGARPRVFL